jgi:hypothetical protein
LSPAAGALYAVWRRAHPTAKGEPTPDARKALARILAECTDADQAAIYLSWVAESMDEDALRLRGLAPWPGGEIRRRDDLESLSRHIPARLPLALAWEARGRREAEPARMSSGMDPARRTKAESVIESLLTVNPNEVNPWLKPKQSDPVLPCLLALGSTTPLPGR